MLPCLAFQCLKGEPTFSSPCIRSSLSISTFSSCSVPAGAGPCGQGTQVPTAVMLPVCRADGEPPEHQRALQKHSVSDHNKLMDFAHLIEITEMKKLLRMTDGESNDQTA